MERVTTPKYGAAAPGGCGTDAPCMVARQARHISSQRARQLPRWQPCHDAMHGAAVRFRRAVANGTAKRASFGNRDVTVSMA